jgi:hypothetical protein
MSSSLLIGIAFTLFWIALLQMHLIVYDSVRFILTLAYEIEDLLGHDTKIYPDYS